MKLATKLEKIKYIYRDIHQMKKVSELINYISEELIEKVASLLLIIWTISPIGVIFYNYTIKDMDKSFLLFKQYPSSIYWYEILQTIGFLGCILGVITFSKSILQAKVEKVSLQNYIKSNLFYLLLFMMLIWSVISCFNSGNIDISLNGTPYRKEGIITYFTYCGIFCCGYVVRNKRLIKIIFEFFTLCAVVLSILTLVDSKELNNALGLTSDSSIFSQFNHYAYYLCMSIMSASLLFITEKKSIQKLIFRIIIFSVITAALIKNGSFGPYIAVIVGLIFSIIFSILLDRKVLKRVAIVTSVFVAITLGMNISNSHTYKDFWTLGGDIFKIAEKSPDADKAGTGRWILWVNGVRFISERPLFGYGADNIGDQYAKVNVNTDRAHNEIIQFAASLGIPAALLYIAALATYFMFFIKKRKQFLRLDICILCIVIAYLASSMFGNTMYYTSPFFFMILGISSGRQKLLLKSFSSYSRESENLFLIKS
ncbi:O-antigen ligase family protein [Clostridium diolis]|uniref:O-antigen ligase family protein n=1 Tax=Clostridium diolis TaxID=223919 RepID=UPI003AF8F48B